MVVSVGLLRQTVPWGAVCSNFFLVHSPIARLERKLWGEQTSEVALSGSAAGLGTEVPARNFPNITLALRYLVAYRSSICCAVSIGTAGCLLWGIDPELERRARSNDAPALSVAFERVANACR